MPEWGVKALVYVVCLGAPTSQSLNPYLHHHQCKERAVCVDDSCYIVGGWTAALESLYISFIVQENACTSSRM
jgi:hypothetical protein